MKKIMVLVLTLVLGVSMAFAGLPVGSNAPALTLDGKLGGRVDGAAWSSSELTGKVFVLVYADPDEADLNNTATEALKAEGFPDDKYGSIAVVNMAATWKPNKVIEWILGGKQEKYPSTVYVKDMNKTMVKNWNLLDDSNDIIVFDKSGKVVFCKDGQLSQADIDTMIKIIKENL